MRTSSNFSFWLQFNFIFILYSNLFASSPPSASFYMSLYRWASADLLGETSTFTSLESIATYRKKETCHPSRVFGKDHDKFVRVVACREGESVCSDEASDP